LRDKVTSSAQSLGLPILAHDELATAAHSITSSAATNSLSGTVRLSILAV
jgi:hypothetical protein